MPKEWSGERLETFILNNTTLEHLHRYAVAMSITKNKIVLDIACGEGYGAYLLASEATIVIGVDINVPTIQKAKRKYQKPNLQFKVGSVLQIPEKDNSIDVVVSFETLEHITEHAQMLIEIKRVLKAEGTLIISTPDKKQYTDETGEINPYHLKELHAHEFKALIQTYFRQTTFLQQSFICVSSIFPEKTNNNFAIFNGNYTTISSGILPKAVYQIAVASDTNLFTFDNSFFYNETINKILYNEKEALKRTLTYRVGNLLLSPFKFLRSLFRK